MLSGFKKELELVERHALVLKLLMKNQPIGIIKLSELCSMPMHKVRYSLRVLERSGMIMPSKKGAVVTKKGLEFAKKLPAELKGIEQRIAKLYSLAEL